MGIFSKIKNIVNQSESTNINLDKNYADSSTIPENERQFYQNDEYYTIKTHEATPFEFTVVPFEQRKQNQFPSKRGLYVPEILFLSFCKNFPNPKNGFPGYWWFKYGVRDVGAMMRSLEQRGFIEINEKTNRYRTTEIGEAELTENEYVVYTHKNSKLINFTAWEMNLLLANNDKTNWIDIFCEKTGSQPPIDVERTKKTHVEENQIINPRVSLSQIKNIDDWDTGYKEGSPYYYKGEQYYKVSQFYSAIEQYDLARYYGYDAPALYESYARAFRKLKDYDNEIDILTEALNRSISSGKRDKFIARIDKAIALRDKNK